MSSAPYVVWSQSWHRRRSRSAPRVGRPRIVITFWPAQWIRCLHALPRYVVDIHIDEWSSHLFNEAISRSWHVCVDTLRSLLARHVDSYRLNSWSRLKKFYETFNFRVGRLLQLGAFFSNALWPFFTIALWPVTFKSSRITRTRQISSSSSGAFSRLCSFN